MFDKLSSALDSLIRSRVEAQVEETSIKKDIANLRVMAVSLGRRDLEIERKTKLLNAIIQAGGFYIWQKDIDGIYQYCDPQFAHDFFGLIPTLADEVFGRSDLELINDFKERSGLRHSFGNLCASTDRHVMVQGHRCRYIEMGYIGKNLFVLDVVKTPLFDEDEDFEGTLGFAWNRSFDLNTVYQEVAGLVSSGMVEQLAGNDEVGVFWVKPPEKTKRKISLMDFLGISSSPFGISAMCPMEGEECSDPCPVNGGSEDGQDK